MCNNLTTHGGRCAAVAVKLLCLKRLLKVFGADAAPAHLDVLQSKKVGSLCCLHNSSSVSVDLVDIDVLKIQTALVHLSDL
jgi:hypothetical protein